MRRASKAVPGVLWTAYNLLGPGGYAEEARSFVLELDRSGLNVAAESLDLTPEGVGLAPGTMARIEHLCQRSLPDSVPRVHHVFPHHFHPQDGRVNIVRTMLESSRVPLLWVESLKQADEVWVPSAFNLESFARSGVPEEKLRIVHEFLPFYFRGNGGEALPLKNRKKFRFLSVFWNWTLRKGWDILIRAFVEEFSAGEDVALVLKTGPLAGTERIPPRDFLRDFLREAGQGRPGPLPEIEFFTGPLPPEEVPNLYRACDCFVLPSRGEGWGRPYMEAMAMGLPVIGTGWGGNTEFMNPGNSYLLHAPLRDIPERGWAESYFLSGKWAEPSIRELREMMRNVYQGPEEARRRAVRGREDIAKRFGGERIAGEIREHLFRLSPVKGRGPLKRPASGYVIDLSGSPDSPVRVRDTLALEDLAPRLKKKGVKRLILVGTGRAARQTAENLLSRGIEILFFLERQAQQALMGRPVKNIEAIHERDFEGADLVLMTAYPAVYREVRRRLLDRGCRVPILPWVLFFDVSH